MAEEHRPVVALVGRRLPDNENLGLGYLAAALEAGGVECRVFHLNGGEELPRVAGAILAAGPGLVGVSIPDGGSAFLPMALVEVLRRRGFAGHITAGGPFATTARRFLLERCPSLDSVVRFAGEGPVLELAHAVAQGAGLDRVRGLTTRRGDGEPSNVLDNDWQRLVPRRAELPTIATHRACHLSMARGCAGRCAYCGPAALQRLELAEGRAGGYDRAALRDAGVGGVRRRGLASVCDEMASLYHERGVRYFYFVDEHLLPYQEAAALAFLSDWAKELRRRRVGPLGLGCMLRADRLTPAVVEKFVEVGLLRAFVGYELATEVEGRAYGRPAPTVADIELLRTFERCGVVTVSNLMLVHPESTPSSIGAGLELLSSIPAGVFEATRMMPYHGTALTERLASEGRLRGNPLRYSYTFRSSSVARFDELFLALRGQAFFDYSLAYRTHDVFLAAALQARVDGQGLRLAARRRLELLRRSLNALQVSSYRQAWQLAEHGADRLARERLVGQTRARSLALLGELAEIEGEVGVQQGAGLKLLQPLRAAVASAVTFCMTGVAALGCYSADEGQDDGTDPDDSASASLTDEPTVTDTQTSAACLDEEAVAARLAEQLPCFSGWVGPGSQGEVDAGFDVWSSYNYMWRPCYDDPKPAALSEAAKSVLAEPPLCASVTGVSVEGGADEDLDDMAAAAGPCLEQIQQMQYPEYAILLDAEGRVTEVMARGASMESKEAAECLAAVLVGLEFPCLSDFSICPEYAIAE